MQVQLSFLVCQVKVGFYGGVKQGWALKYTNQGLTLRDVKQVWSLREMPGKTEFLRFQ